MWFDDIIAHDFRKPQDGQHLSCQENVYRILQQMPSCPKSSIFRPFRLVMEQKQCTRRGHRKQTAFKPYTSEDFNDAAGIRIFFTVFLYHAPSFMGEAETPECRHTSPSLLLPVFIPRHLPTPTSLTIPA